MSAIDRFMGAVSVRECDACGGIEERVFTDSWTGKDLCLMCLSPVAGHITNSPASEGDNLIELLPELGDWGREDG